MTFKFKKKQKLFSFSFLSLNQLSITMGTVRQAVITPRMSSTLGSTAGCALTTRQWRSSTSTRCWSRLQSAPPTCCTTAVSTCCRHAHKRTSRHTRRNTWKYSQTHINIHAQNALVDIRVHLHMTRTHTKLMNRNTAQLVLLQDFPLPPSCPRFPENQLFQRLFLVSFWKKRNKLHSQSSLWLLSLLCAPLLFFVLFLFYF